MSPRVSASDWEAFLASRPEAHLLQTAAWGELKSHFGWQVERLVVGDCGAQVLFRRLPLGLTLAYVPKGPVGDWLPGLLPDLDALCRERRAFALKIEPDLAAGASQEADLRSRGLRASRHTVQPPRTLVVDLRGTEEVILARMLQKTRYNIGLAVRKGVSVRVWEDLEGFCRMMQVTAARDRFGSHTPAYYRLAYDLFHPSDACEMLVAEAEGQPLAAVMIFARGSRAWYLYGASSDRERNRMPTYLLQWQAICWARARGCISYDLWGVPDADRNQLEAQFTSRSDGLWGVYRFKRGFGGELVRSTGAWDRPYNVPLHALYRFLIAQRTSE